MWTEYLNQNFDLNHIAVVLIPLAVIVAIAAIGKYIKARVTVKLGFIFLLVFSIFSFIASATSLAIGIYGTKNYPDMYYAGIFGGSIAWTIVNIVVVIWSSIEVAELRAAERAKDRPTID